MPWVVPLIQLSIIGCTAWRSGAWLAQVKQHTMIATYKLNALKNAYAEMIVEGMDMKSLITLAVESIEQNLKDYDMDDLKEEVCDCYGEETWTDMTSWVTVHSGLHHPPIDAILNTYQTTHHELHSQATSRPC